METCTKKLQNVYLHVLSGKILLTRKKKRCAYESKKDEYFKIIIIDLQ